MVANGTFDGRLPCPIARCPAMIALQAKLYSFAVIADNFATAFSCRHFRFLSFWSLHPVQVFFDFMCLDLLPFVGLVKAHLPDVA